MNRLGERQAMRQADHPRDLTRVAALGNGRNLTGGRDILRAALDPLDTIKIGTCAWSYDDWRGGFYPEHLPPAERLAYYAQHFRAVEVDATFYHAPAPNVARHWAEATPPDFVFSCKAPREITHERRLRDCAEPLEAFLRSLDPLGEKLGCVLVQLPPSFRPRQDEAALREFVRALPRSMRFAIEFRDHALAPAAHRPFARRTPRLLGVDRHHAARSSAGRRVRVSPADDRFRLRAVARRSGFEVRPRMAIAGTSIAI